jgi:hypothetical protein
MSEHKIHELADAIGTMALEYAEKSDFTPNEVVNALAVAFVIVAFTLKGDDADLGDLKGKLTDAVAGIFDETAETIHEKA